MSHLLTRDEIAFEWKVVLHCLPRKDGDFFYFSRIVFILTIKFKSIDKEKIDSSHLFKRNKWIAEKYLGYENQAVCVIKYSYFTIETRSIFLRYLNSKKYSQLKYNDDKYEFFSSPLAFHFRCFIVNKFS